MFKTIRLGNFKAFSAVQEIPLRPLTVIFGPNSSGKSSLIHGLLFAHEAFTNDEPDNLDVKRPRIGGDAVDLGGFRQFVHRRNTDNRVEWGVTLDTSKMTGRLGEILKSAGEVTVTVQIGLMKTDQREIIAVQSYEIRSKDTKFLSASLKKRPTELWLGLDELDTDNPIIMNSVHAMVAANTTTEKLDEADFEAINAAIDELVPLLELKKGSFLPEGVFKPGAAEQPDLRSTFYPVSKANRHKELTEIASIFVPRLLNELVGGLHLHISETIKKMRYLGPLRSYPSRHLAFSQEYDTNWYAGGGYAWDRIRQDPAIRSKVNQWLGSSWMKTPYELVVRDLYSSSDLENPFWKTLEQLQEDGLDMEADYDDKPEPEGAFPIIKDFEKEVKRFHENLNKSNIEIIRDLVLLDINRKTIVSHRDVGIGVSQVLPVLVYTLAAQNELLAMEQPELHLHPALQAELGDVFIEAAIDKGNTFLLETHSEHLILRLLRRIRETTEGNLPKNIHPLHPEDLMIIYAQPTAEGTILHQITATKDGEFATKCPEGFFAERAKELF